jgi:SAM-dependent methyltransferase
MRTKVIKAYSLKFYKSVDFRANESAISIFGILDGFLDVKSLKSIIDVGCGSGAWLNAALKNTSARVYGYDLPESIEINQGRFGDNFNKRLELVTSDFESKKELKFQPAQLGICLEVLEHLKDKTGRRILESMSSSCEVILFSAATPGQGGTGHINERQHSYWLEKFRLHGFEVYDCIRPELQSSKNSARYYALNTFLLVKSSSLGLGLVEVSKLQPFLRTNDVNDFRSLRERIQSIFIGILPVKVVTFLSKFLSH